MNTLKVLISVVTIVVLSVSFSFAKASTTNGEVKEFAITAVVGPKVGIDGANDIKLTLNANKEFYYNSKTAKTPLTIQSNSSVNVALNCTNLTNKNSTIEIQKVNFIDGDNSLQINLGDNENLSKDVDYEIKTKQIDEAKTKAGTYSGTCTLTVSPFGYE